MSLGLQKLARKSAISSYHRKLQRKLIISFLRKDCSVKLFSLNLLYRESLSSVYRENALQLQEIK